MTDDEKLSVFSALCDAAWNGEAYLEDVNADRDLDEYPEPLTWEDLEREARESYVQTGPGARAQARLSAITAGLDLELTGDGTVPGTWDPEAKTYRR